jgi:hypothetical protein
VAKYRVYGSKEIKYYMDVEAEDLKAAVQAADRSDSHLLNQMADDENINPFDVIEYEELVDLSTNLQMKWA